MWLFISFERQTTDVLLRSFKPILDLLVATWEELLGGCRDLGLLGDAVSMVGAAGATRRTEAGHFLHALRQRGNLQSPQHVHWVWGKTHSSEHVTHTESFRHLCSTWQTTLPLCICTPSMCTLFFLTVEKLGCYFCVEKWFCDRWVTEISADQITDYSDINFSFG